MMVHTMAPPSPSHEEPGSAGPAVFAHELAAGSDVVEVVAPNVVLVAHWKRLRDGELYAVTPRLSWALLMR